MKSSQDKPASGQEENINMPEAEEPATDPKEISDEANPADNQAGDEDAENMADSAGKAEAELQEMKDKYLRLFAEFENYKRRTSKERLDLLKTANQEMIAALLPVVDDLERAKKANEDATEIEAVKQGIDLVFNKLTNVLQQKGLKPMDAAGQPFDADLHEAITQVPGGEDLKGKVVDEIEKGYYLNDKVIRFAKVIIGA